MKSVDLYQLAFEAFTNVVIVDKHGKIVYINEMYARLLGYDKKEITGKSVSDIIPGTRMLEVIQTGKAQTGDLMTLYDHENRKQVSVICNRFPLIEKW